MHCFDLLVSAATVAFVLSDGASAFPSARHHHTKSDKHRQHKEQQHHHHQHHQQQQKQVSAQQSRNDLAINKMQQQSEESATEATAAEFSTSALSDVAMWEYNIFLDDDRLNLQYDDYDYTDDYFSKGQYENDDYEDQGLPTIQNLILLAATHPRRNRNVFGLPPREVVIY